MIIANAAVREAPHEEEVGMDIQAPLNRVMGLLRLLAATRLDDRQRRQVQLIADAAGEIDALLNEARRAAAEPPTSVWERPTPSVGKSFRRIAGGG